MAASVTAGACDSLLSVTSISPVEVRRGRRAGGQAGGRAVSDKARDCRDDQMEASGRDHRTRAERGAVPS